MYHFKILLSKVVLGGSKSFRQSTMEKSLPAFMYSLQNFARQEVLSKGPRANTRLKEESVDGSLSTLPRVSLAILKAELLLLGGQFARIPTRRVHSDCLVHRIAAGTYSV